MTLSLLSDADSKIVLKRTHSNVSHQSKTVISKCLAIGSVLKDWLQVRVCYFIVGIENSAPARILAGQRAVTVFMRV